MIVAFPGIRTRDFPTGTISPIVAEELLGVTTNNERFNVCLNVSHIYDTSSPFSPHNFGKKNVFNLKTNQNCFEYLSVENKVSTWMQRFAFWWICNEAEMMKVMNVHWLFDQSFIRPKTLSVNCRPAAILIMSFRRCEINSFSWNPITRGGTIKGPGQIRYILCRASNLDIQKQGPRLHAPLKKS